MSNKVGLLVHPFWLNHNMEKHLDYYSNIIASNEYDELFIIVPMLNTENRKDILDLHFRNLLIYFLGLTETMISSLDVEHYKKSYENIVTDLPYFKYFILRTMVKYIKSINGSIKRHKTKQDKLLFIYNILLSDKNFIMENIGDGILTYMFNGDMETDDRVNYIEKLLNVKSKTKVKPLYYGGIGTFNILVSYNDDFAGVKEIDIFGEYFNICVLGAARYLYRDEGIDVNLIRKHSVYYNNKYLEKIIKQNKSKRYLAVYNPKIKDMYGNIFLLDKYYDKENNLG